MTIPNFLISLVTCEKFSFHVHFNLIRSIYSILLCCCTYTASAIAEGCHNFLFACMHKCKTKRYFTIIILILKSIKPVLQDEIFFATYLATFGKKIHCKSQKTSCTLQPRTATCNASDIDASLTESGTDLCFVQSLQ